ncbi:MAG: hypothetical protein ABJ249_18490, partial [Lentilitoribacter sp.]
TRGRFIAFDRMFWELHRRAPMTDGKVSRPHRICRTREKFVFKYTIFHLIYQIERPWAGRNCVSESGRSDRKHKKNGSEQSAAFLMGIPNSIV